MGNMNLDNIAQATGGRAFYSRNDLEQILIDATNLGANYYTLTYAPSNQNYDGKLRKIKVNFPRKGYQLDYRRAYYADGLGSPVSQASSKQASSRKSAATEPAVAEPDDSLYAYMRPGAPMAHQLFFRAHIYPVGAPALATASQMSNLEEQPAYFRVRRESRPAEPLPPCGFRPMPSTTPSQRAHPTPELQDQWGPLCWKLRPEPSTPMAKC